MSTTTKTKTKTKTKGKSFAEKRDEAKAALEDMHALLAEKIESDEDWLAHLRFVSRLHAYSPRNVMLMWAQWIHRQRFTEVMRAMQPAIPSLPDLTYQAGGSAWIEKGGHIRKGEKALSVLAPFTITDKDDLDDQGKPRKKVIGFVLKSRTFDISQIEGVEAPDAPVTLLTGEGPEGVWESLVALVDEIGFSLDVEPVQGSANGFMQASTKRVVVDSGLDPAQQVKTLTHEIAHAMLHADGAYIPRDVAEVEAESTAYLVAHLIGFDTSSYSLGYVAGWSGGSGEILASTTSRVVDTATRIVEWLTEGHLRPAKGTKAHDFGTDPEAAAAEAA